MKMKFESGFVFFAYTKGEKEEISNELDRTNVNVTDVYCDSDGDWNIECVIEIEINIVRKGDMFNQIDKAISKALKKANDFCWDYHYIKGINNDYYWQP